MADQSDIDEKKVDEVANPTTKPEDAADAEAAGASESKYVYVTGFKLLVVIACVTLVVFLLMYVLGDWLSTTTVGATGDWA